MNLLQRFSKWALVLCLVLIIGGAAQLPQPAWASMEDAAIFYDELKQQGEWVDYGNYGPVWYPTQVKENWRPYVDGRWAPTEEGYVFETQEPWGYATYHYGNWMPTQEYGWVWVPGRTWYPNTVSWRTSPESQSPDASYIGWAPIPPADYTPASGYYPQDYSGGGSYGGGLNNLLTSPFWIFVKAASFLLGLNSPYTPTYSYWGCNCLVPVQAVPYYYTRTIIVNNYYTPAYYPVGYITGGGCYNWGPPIPYVARVTRINPGVINNYMRQVNIYQRANVVPPAAVLARHSYFRDVVPPAMLSQQPLPPGSRFRGPQVGRANLVQPNLVNANVIKNAPSLSATIPKAQLTPGESGARHRGVPGAALPASAMIQPSKQMDQRQKNIPPSQRLEPVSPSARQWTVPQATLPPAAVPRKPEAPVVQPPPGAKYRAPEATSAKPGAPGTPPPGIVPYPHGTQGTPQTMTPGPSQPVGSREKFKPGEHQPSPWSRPDQLPPGAAAPGAPPKQKSMQTYPPGTPPPTTATTPQNLPPRRVVTPPPPPQQVPNQPAPQVHHQPPPPPQPQVHHQPPPPPQPQVHQQSQPQVQSHPQAPVKQQDKKPSQQTQ